MTTVKNEAFEIGGEVCPPGQRLNMELPIAKLYTHSQISVPIRVVCGKYGGPRLFVSAAIHGDEINGVEIIRRLLRQKTIRDLRGTLVVAPIVNVHGFLTHSRYMPDRRDLNRSFPGAINGSLAARLARLFLDEVVARCTHGIDLHTGANHRCNLPQIRAWLDDPATLKLARAFGTPVLINANLRDGSLRQAVVEAGKPLLLYEGGEILRFNDFAVRAGLRGILAVMRSLGMLSARLAKNRARPFIAQSTRWIRAPQSGIFHAKRQLGNVVKKGDILGEIGDHFGENLADVESPADGVIIGVSSLPLANKGDALFNLANTDQAEGEPETVETWAERAEDLDPANATFL